jgi:hypothetical protein
MRGAVWFQPFLPPAVTLHLCIAPGLRGRWVTPRTLKYLAASARAIGAAHVVAHPLPEHRALVDRLGFEHDPTHGGFTLDLFADVNTRCPGAAAAAPAGRSASEGDLRR